MTARSPVASAPFSTLSSTPALDILKAINGLIPLFPGTFKTTIGTTNKRSSAFDNIWIDTDDTGREYTGESGAYDFDDELYPGVTDAFKIAREEISDHVPVWATFYTDRDDDRATAADPVSWGKVKAGF